MGSYRVNEIASIRLFTGLSVLQYAPQPDKKMHTSKLKFRFKINGLNVFNLRQY